MLPSGDLAALTERVWGSFLGRCVRRFLAMSGIDRCIVISSQAFTALIPLLILVSALAPAEQPDVIASAVIRRFGLTGQSASAVEQLFAVPEGVASSISVFSGLLLVFSGVSFIRRVQSMYRGAWEIERAGVRSGLFAALGLFALLGEVLILYGVLSLARRLSFDLLALPLTAIAGLVLWTSIPYLLLDRSVHWRRLLVAGALSALGTAVYGVVTAVYMPPTVERYTNDFGLFGITIVLIGWLLIISSVLVACAAVGAEFDKSRAPWAVRLKVKFRLLDPDAELPVASEAAQEAGLTTGDLLMLVRVLVNWLVIAAAVWVATALVPGIDVPGGFATYFGVSVLLGLVNAVLGPLLNLVSLPLSVFTLGLTALVLNGILLEVTAGLSANLDVGGLGNAILGALVISIVTTLLELVLRPMSRLETFSSARDEAEEHKRANSGSKDSS